jgi:hypothetical protein
VVLRPRGAAAGGDVALTSGVAIECEVAGGRVVRSAPIAIKRIVASSRVVAAGCEAEQRIITLDGVGAGIASVRGWTNGSGDGRNREAGECDNK